MDGIARESLLYDFYGILLTAKKRQVMELYHEDDMSLSEIAEEMDITRAAVYDSLKSAERQLENYEEKLKLLAKYEENSVLAGKADEIIKKAALSDSDAEELRGIIEKLSSAEA